MSVNSFIKGAMQSNHSKKPLNSSKPVISAEQLNVWYHELQVLYDINIQIPRHCITALIGPSGCGKTTFLRCLNRLNDITKGFKLSGRILLEDEDIYDPSYNVNALRSRVGMVFQDPNPFPMSIYNNLTLPLKENNLYTNRAEADKIVMESLRAAGLYEEVKDRLHQSALKLSGGQQQRLCIARALTIKPEVLLLDEPCSSLDPISTAKIESLLIDLTKKYTIVIVTHNLQQAARIADYIAFFYLGRIVEQGPAEQILVNPQVKQTDLYLRGLY